MCFVSITVLLTVTRNPILCTLPNRTCTSNILTRWLTCAKHYTVIHLCLTATQQLWLYWADPEREE